MCYPFLLLVFVALWLLPNHTSAGVFYCLTHSTPPIVSASAQLWWDFKLDDESDAKDVLTLLIPQEMASRIHSTHVQMTAVLEDSNYTSNSDITESNDQIIISFTLPSNLISGEIVIQNVTQTVFGFTNPESFTTTHEIQVYYNNLLQYTDQWRPSQYFPRMEYLKGGPHNPVIRVVSPYYYRFQINRYIQPGLDTFLIQLHVEMRLKIEECSLSLANNDTFQISPSEYTCRIQKNDHDYLKYVILSFTFNSSNYRPYTVFEVEIAEVKNPITVFPYSFRLQWIRNQIVVENYTSSFEIYPSKILEWNLDSITHNGHEEITELNFHLQITRQFSKYDVFKVVLNDFEMNPEQLTTICAVEVESTLSAPECKINSNSPVVLVSGLPEDTTEFTLVISEIKNPHTCSEYIATLYWLNSEVTIWKQELYIPMQFSEFSWNASNLTVSTTNNDYYLYFSFYLEMQEHWRIDVIFPEDYSFTDSVECSIESEIIECNFKNNLEDEIILEIVIPAPTIPADSAKLITIRKIDNPSHARSHSFKFLFYDHNGFKKAYRQSLIQLECQYQYFWSYELKECFHCENPCQECFLMPQKCTSCVEGAFKLGEDSCVVECPSGYYPNNDLECEACPDRCTSCKLEDSGLTCKSCLTPYFLNNTDCQICEVDSCKACDSSDPTVCTECMTNYFFVDGKCKSCNSSCLECETSENHCIRCPYEYLLFQNQCYQECPSGTFPSAGVCIECIAPKRATTGVMFQIKDYDGISDTFKYNVIPVKESLVGVRSIELCEYLFDAVSFGKLGSEEDFFCVFASNILIIRLGQSFNFDFEEILTLKDDVIMTQNCPGYTNKAITFQTPDKNSDYYPSAEIRYPARVYKKSSFKLNLEKISLNGHKQLSQISWKVASISLPLSSTYASDLETEINSVLANSENLQIATIDEFTLQEGNYTFEATFCNWIGFESSAQTGTIQALDTLVPIMDSEYSTEFAVENTSPLLLISKFHLTDPNSPDRVYQMDEFEFFWNLQSSHSLSCVKFTKNHRKLYIPPLTLEVTDEAYLFEVKITNKDDPNIWAQQNFTVTVSETPPSCHLYGVGPHYENQMIRLNSNKSSDLTRELSGFNTVYELLYEWKCVDTQSGQPCQMRNGKNVTTISNIFNKFDPYDFEINSVLTISLTCTNRFTGTSSSDTGIITILPKKEKNLNVFCPYSVNGIIGKKLPLACYLNMRQLIDIEPEEMNFKWSSSIPADYFINGDSLPYLIINTTNFERSNSFDVSLKVTDSDGEYEGIGGFSVGFITYALAGNLNVEPLTSNNGFGQVFQLSVAGWGMSTDECPLTYVFYWSISGIEHWHFLAKTQGKIITTTKKPCRKISFKVVVYTCEFADVTGYSSDIDNSKGCDADPLIEDLLEAIDLATEEDIIEFINAAVYLLKHSDLDAEKLIEYKKTVLEVILELDDLRVDNNWLEVLNDEFKTHMLSELILFKNIDADFALSCFDFFYVLIWREYDLIQNIGTSDALQLDLMDYSDFTRGLKEADLDKLLVAFDQIVDTLNLADKLGDLARNYEILDLIVTLANSKIKNIYPFEEEEGIKYEGKNFNFTIFKLFPKWFKNITISHSTIAVQIGKNGFISSGFDIEDTAPYLFLVGEFIPQLTADLLPNCFTRSIGRIAFFNEKSQSYEIIPELETEGGINVTLLLDDTKMNRQQIDTVSIIRKSNFDSNFSIGSEILKNNTNTQASFVLKDLDYFADFSTEINSHYSIVVGPEVVPHLSDATNNSNYMNINSKLGKNYFTWRMITITILALWLLI